MYLVRHAIAGIRGPEWPDDDLRPLTDRGISRFKKAVAGLAALDVTVDEVLTSPLVRARQTADLLGVGLSGRPPVRVLDSLAPGQSAGHTIAEVLRVARGRRVAVVGHEPSLGELAAVLIGARRAIPFKKGGVCRIDMAAPADGTLVWLATPGILRRLTSSKA